MEKALDESFAPALSAVVLSATVLVGLVLFSAMPVNHDASIYLQCAQLLLEGKLPYVDYVELNPPMAHYIHVPVVAVAHLLDLNVTGVFQYMVLLLVGYSTMMLIHTMRKAEVLSGRATRLIVAAGWLAFSVFVFSDAGFGQREHLFALTYVPLLFVRFARYKNIPVAASTTIFTAALAGPMILLKPHFVAMVVLAELVMMLRFRRIADPRCPEIAVVLLMAVAYVLHFFLWPEVVREQFFFRWVPAIAEHYNTYDKSTEYLVTKVAGMWLVAGGVILISLFVSRALHRSQVTLLYVLMVLVVSAAAFYLVQQKGWSYHRYPAVGFVAVLGAICAAHFAEVVRRIKIAGSHRPIFAALYPVLLLALLLVALGGWAADAGRVGLGHLLVANSYVAQIEEHTRDDDRVVFISTIPNPGSRVMIYARRQSGTRYLCAFPIAFAYDGVESTSVSDRPYRTRSEWTADERLFLEEMGSDIAGTRPKMVFIQSSQCVGCPSWFRITDYLRESGWQNLYLDDYVLQRRMLKYDVYMRVPETNSIADRAGKEEDLAAIVKSTLPTSSGMDRNGLAARR